LTNRKYLIGTVLLILVLNLSFIQYIFSDHVVGNNITFTETGFSDSTIGTQGQKARLFFGDASPAIWQKSGIFETTTTTPSNATQFPNGQFEAVVSPLVTHTAPYAMKKSLKDINAIYLADYSQTPSFALDPIIFPIAQDCDAINPFTARMKFFVAFRIKIENPEHITTLNKLNGTIVLQQFVSDGQALIEGKNTASIKFNFINSNKTSTITTLYQQITVDFDGSGSLGTGVEGSEKYRVLNFNMIELLDVDNINATFTDNNVPRLRIETFYDDINAQDTWTINQDARGLDVTLRLTPRGTCDNPVGDPDTQLLKARTWWNWDRRGFCNLEDWRDCTIFTDVESTTNKFINAWTYNKGAEVGTSGGGIDAFNWNITRNGDRYTTDFQGNGFALDHKSFTDWTFGGGADSTSCGLGTVGASPRLLAADPREFTVDLKQPHNEEALRERLLFDFDFAYDGTVTNVSNGNPCTLRTTIVLSVINPDGGTVATTTITQDNTLTGTSASISATGAFDSDNYINFGNVTQALTRATLKIQTSFSVISSVGSISGDTVANHHVRLDSFVTNWVGEIIPADIDLCPTSTPNDCAPKPPWTPTDDDDNDDDGSDDPCPFGAFCNGDGRGDDGGGDGGTIGNINLTCGEIITWEAIDLNNTDAASTTVTGFITNFFTLLGCAPSLTIPLIVLIGGLGTIVGGAVISGTKDASILAYVAVFFIIVWGILFTLTGFFPIWVAILIPIIGAGLIFAMLRRGSGAA